jgi:hypothetical protein
MTHISGVNSKYFESRKRLKISVDKWIAAWYSNQAVGAAVPRRGLKSENFEEIQKSA